MDSTHTISTYRIIPRISTLIYVEIPYLSASKGFHYGFVVRGIKYKFYADRTDTSFDQMVKTFLKKWTDMPTKRDDEITMESMLEGCYREAYELLGYMVWDI